jgi:hypothetical protein
MICYQRLECLDSILPRGFYCRRTHFELLKNAMERSFLLFFFEEVGLYDFRLPRYPFGAAGLRGTNAIDLRVSASCR